MVAFGWAYPGILAAGWRVEHLCSAPIGLLPSPTLALVLGLSILGSGFGSRVWALLLGAAGGFYGLDGALRLGLAHDLVLLAGALVLIGQQERAARSAGVRSSAEIPGSDAGSPHPPRRAGMGSTNHL